MLSHSENSRSVIVPGRGRKNLVTAVEGVRSAFQKDFFAKVVQESVDEMDRVSDEAINDAMSENENVSEGNGVELAGFELIECNIAPHIGTRVQVFWSEAIQIFAGVVAGFDPETGKHNISYDDGDKEDLLMRDETWR